MKKLETLMEAVEGAYFVQSDQVALGRASWAEQCDDCPVRPRAATGTPPRDAAEPSASV
jgi:hypothetical protein